MSTTTEKIVAIKEMCRKLIKGERFIEAATMQDYINWYNSQEI